MGNLARFALTVGAAALFAGCGRSYAPTGASNGIPLKLETQPLDDTGARQYQVLFRFGLSKYGYHGRNPVAPLYYANGTFYGTTAYGGKSSGIGVVFSLNADHKFKVLHTFSGLDGDEPFGGLTPLHGKLYGTTNSGGRYGYGTIYRITTDGDYRLLYSFNYGSGSRVSAGPYGNLVAVNGKLYGTTISGASGDYGTVYSVSTQGNVHVLHTFDGVDGASPTAGLLYVNGELYGTTMSGGAYRKGTVFRISTSGEEKVLFSFDGSNGGGPAAPLIALDGRLYGTTEDGGSAGLGTVFSMAIGGDQETVLHSFGNEKGDGYRPEAGLIARHGMLYGTTALGGTYNRDRCQGTCGTIFSITTGGKERIIHRFEHRYKNDGATPMANLIDVNGKLYGTTEDGGYSPKCGSYPCYDGTVFDVVP